PSPGGAFPPPHPLGKSFPADLLPSRLQVLVDSRTTVTAFACLMRSADLQLEPTVVSRASGFRSKAPRIESGPGDLEDSTHRCYRKVRLLRLDERESHSFSLAKKAVAFFKISRSIRRVRTSRRSCASSVRSSVVNPPGGPFPRSLFPCFTQIDN